MKFLCWYHTNLVSRTHLPTRMDLISTKRPQCVVCTTENNIDMKPGTQFFIQPMSKTFIYACITYVVHVHSGIHLNSKWHLFPDLCGKTCFEILHWDTCDGLWRKVQENMASVRVALHIFYCRVNMGLIQKKTIKSKIIIFCTVYVYYFGTLKSQSFKQILDQMVQCWFV